jgi:ABC-type multidrug transport system permease subunit
MKPRGRLNWLANAIATYAVELTLWILAPLAAMGCFILFDLFHITQTWLMMALLALPVLFIAYSKWRCV